MKPLTIYQAEAEARWRWSSLLARGFARYASANQRPFEVGIKRIGSIEILGRGTSWEGAFGNADSVGDVKRPRK